jgi:MFS family permease
MGIFIGVCTYSYATKCGLSMGLAQTGLLALPLAPVVGGWLATFASWRIMQLCIALMGLIVFIMVVLLLPETSHPGARGIEKFPLAESLEIRSVHSNKRSCRFLPLNPFRTLCLLKSPIVVLVVNPTFCKKFPLGG